MILVLTLKATVKSIAFVTRKCDKISFSEKELKLFAGAQVLEVIKLEHLVACEVHDN